MLKYPHRPALAHGRVRFVGEPVALVVAESETAAQDAAELIAVDYRDLPAVTEPRGCARGRRPRCMPMCPDNLAMDYEYGNRAAADEAFAKAATHRAHCELHAQRIAGNPMEPKVLRSRPTTPASGHFDIYMPTQGMADIRDGVRARHRPARRAISASMPRMSAAGSACATKSIRNSPRWRSPRKRSAGRSNGSARARSRS